MLFSKIIKKKFDAVLGRYDGNPACYYFSQKDFPNIKSLEFDIKGDRNILLKGSFYYYGEMNADKLVIFDHGIGAGYLAYFKEIEKLASRGYTVYSYDHTGCVSSGGEGIYGFAQGINDLDHVISTLKNDARFKNKNIRVMGHSWGGYSAMNCMTLHSEITHVVSVSGFLSARSLVEQYLPKFVMKYSDEVMDRERKNNPKYADMDAIESIKKSDAKLLYIQSRDDKKVLYSKSYEPLFHAFARRKDTDFISLDKRNHVPHYTEHAAAAYDAFVAKLQKLSKQKKLVTKEEQNEFRNSTDWNEITEQDENVWNKIFEFLDN